MFPCQQQFVYELGKKAIKTGVIFTFVYKFTTVSCFVLDISINKPILLSTGSFFYVHAFNIGGEGFLLPSYNMARQKKQQQKNQNVNNFELYMLVV